LSLDVYLEEAEAACPGCRHVHTCNRKPTTLYWANITHNLGAMAEEARLYAAIWRPDEHGYRTAGQIVPVVTVGLADLKARPEHFQQFNAKNGWGLYENFVPFVEKYLDACMQYPSALIRVCR